MAKSSSETLSRDRSERPDRLGGIVHPVAVRMPSHADDEAALIHVLIDEVQLGVAGRTLLAIFSVRVAVLNARKLPGVDGV
jgi:hypothetical protein